MSDRKFVWAPRKGEGDTAYTTRAFAENDWLGISELIRAKWAYEDAAAKPVEPAAREPAPRNDARELELEREVARLKLDNGQLVRRLAMFQQMIRDLHEERAEMYRWVSRLGGD